MLSKRRKGEHYRGWEVSETNKLGGGFKRNEGGNFDKWWQIHLEFSTNELNLQLQNSFKVVFLSSELEFALVSIVIRKRQRLDMT